MIPLPVIVGILAGLGGTVIGALSRQPEINELKNQVRELQGEVERLQAIIDKQNKDIEVLKIRYKSLKAFDFKEKSQTRGYMRGTLIFSYAYNEYLNLLMKHAKKDNDMSQQSVIFYNIFDKIIEGGTVSEVEKDAVKEYILGLYKYEIDHLIECNCENTLKKLKEFEVA